MPHATLHYNYKMPHSRLAISTTALIAIWRSTSSHQRKIYNIITLLVMIYLLQTSIQPFITYNILKYSPYIRVHHLLSQFTIQFYVNFTLFFIQFTLFFKFDNLINEYNYVYFILFFAHKSGNPTLWVFNKVVCPRDTISYFLGVAQSCYRFPQCWPAERTKLHSFRFLGHN